MTATYDPAGSTDKDRVRRLIGDTDTTAARYADEEIESALSTATGVYAASADLLEGLAARYSGRVNVSVDGASFDYGKVAENLMRMAGRLRAQAATADAGGLGSPTVGGTSISEIEASRENDDRVPNRFTHDMLENPPVDPRTETPIL